MSENQAIQTEMRAKLERQADAVYKERISQIVPSNWEVLGVHTRQIQLTTKALIRQFPEATIDDVLALVDEGFQEQMREEALCAIYWLSTKRAEFDRWLWPLIDRWVEVVDDWEICDALAANIAVFVVAKNMQLVDQLVNWASFPNKWRRRFALSIAAALNQRGRVHVLETLKICHVAMQDDEPIVRKAAARAIRMAGEHDPNAVYTFLYGWRKTGHPTIIREAASKLPAAQQQKLQPPQKNKKAPQ